MKIKPGRPEIFGLATNHLSKLKTVAAAVGCGLFVRPQRGRLQLIYKSHFVQHPPD